VPGRVAADELRTARLWLRRWRAQDEGPRAAVNEDPEVTRYLNRSIDRAATAAFYAGVQEHWAEHGFGFYAVESVADGPGGRFIGFVGVAHPTFVPELAARPELGWRLARVWQVPAPMSSTVRAGLNSTSNELGRAGEATAMTTPKVTEIRRPLHAVTPDSFIRSQVSSPRPSAAVR
jgi:RimJ/RimL family protein N-acetyltransferase